MKYLLDTDSVSYAFRRHGLVAARIEQIMPEDLGISAVTLAELRLGADYKNSARIHRLIDKFVAAIEVIPFDSSAAAASGRIGSLLLKRGTPIGDCDVLIAGHAISLGCVLVTNNVKHFARVPGLKVENWT